MLERFPKAYILSQVIPAVSFHWKRKRILFDGDPIFMNSQRLQTFALKGTKCVTCGIEGVVFYKECGGGSKYILYHLNLYAINKRGKEVLMTKDHIIPKIKGGSNYLSNYQTMCKPCNEKKGCQLKQLKC